MNTTISQNQLISIGKYNGRGFSYTLALLAIAAAVFSRPLVSWGLPGVLNFVHVPLAVLAFAAIPHPPNREIRVVGATIAVFAAHVTASALINGVEPIRFVSALILWLEPPLLAYVAWVALTDQERRDQRARVGVVLLMAVIAAQMVVMTFQIPRQLSLPGGDEMQGTFVGSGTGAHVAPAVVLVGVVILLDSVLRFRRRRVRMLLLAGFGLFLAQMANARAVSVLFVVGLIVGTAVIGHPKLGKRSMAVLMSLLVATIVWMTLPLVANVPGFDRQLPGWTAKAYGVQQAVEDMGRDVSFAVVGQGPGTTLSRVAMQTPDVNLNPSSAVASLGIETTDFTREVVANRRTVAIASSSLFSPATTFVGLLGDVGVVGLAIYLAIWLPIGRALFRESRHSRSLSGPILLITAVLLGTIQIWLEDPGFVLPLTFFIALVASGNLRYLDHRIVGDEAAHHL